MVSTWHAAMNATDPAGAGHALHDVLAAIVPDLQRYCVDAWTLIGSAAARLIGAPVTVADIDVLTSRRDAQTMIGQWQERLDRAWKPADSARFRSCFARFRYPQLAVEIMGGLELFQPTGWVPVHVDAIVQVPVAGVIVPIPALAEQIRVLQDFDRPKDRQRAALLKALDTGTA